MEMTASHPRVLVLVDEPVIAGRWGAYAEDYQRAIEDAGGAAIPLHYATADLDRVPPHDGVLTIGGDDVDPARYGEPPDRHLGPIAPERDGVEFTVTREALADGVPLLAICRGMQLLNVACGGSLLQHIPEHAPHNGQGDATESAWHSIHVVPESLLARIAGSGPLLVNSRHHQGVTRDRLAPSLRATGCINDGRLDLIEAVEVPGHPFALGVQWHPERAEMQASATLEQAGRRIFEAFVAACAVARTA